MNGRLIGLTGVRRAAWLSHIKHISHVAYVAFCQTDGELNVNVNGARASSESQLKRTFAGWKEVTSALRDEISSQQVVKCQPGTPNS